MLQNDRLFHYKLAVQFFKKEREISLAADFKIMVDEKWSTEQLSVNNKTTLI